MLTLGLSFKLRETVEWLTPAIFAISLIVRLIPCLRINTHVCIYIYRLLRYSGVVKKIFVLGYLKGKGIAMVRKWWHKSVVYQIYPKSFFDSDGDGIGDIRGVIRKLEYLSELGVDVLWLSPVNKSPMNDNGYDVSDYYEITPEFGTLEDYLDLIKEAGVRGIKIIMDLVVNHSSDEHPWFRESRSGRNSPKRDWYIWKEPAPDGGPPNNWGSFFERSAWELDSMTSQYYLHLFGKKQPDLNWENPELRKEIYRLMNWWLDKGVAGFRLDVVNAFSKPQDFRDGDPADGIPGFSLWMNGPRIHEFLREMHSFVFDRRDLLTVGEANLVTPAIAAEYTLPERKELDMLFQFEHMSADSDPLNKWERVPLSLVRLKTVLGAWQAGLHGKGWNSLYWNNHDQPRIVSRFGSDSGEFRVLSGKMLATVLHLMHGTPYIYQGEELGMTNARFSSIDDFTDIDSRNYYDIAVNDRGLSPEVVMEQLRWRSRENARTPMQWNADAEAGFTKGKPWLAVNPNYRAINTEAARKDPESLFHFYKKLISLRKDETLGDTVIYGRFEMLLDDDPAIFAYRRILGGSVLTVICNFFGSTPLLQLSGRGLRDAVVPVLSNYKDTEVPLVNRRLRPYESMVYYNGIESPFC